MALYWNKDADERQQKKVAEVAGILKGADIDYKDQGISRWKSGESISSTVPLM